MSEKTHPAHHTPTPVLADAPRLGAAEPHPARDVAPPAPAKAKVTSVPDECAALRTRLDDALAAGDKDAIAKCWVDMDALYAKTGAKSPVDDRNHVAALSARFHHFAPRNP